MSKPKRRLLFSLIELLVVIGIISILMSLLLPALKGARDVAKQLVCSSNLRQLSTAMNAYSSNSEGCLPYAKVKVSNTNAWNNIWTWDDALTVAMDAKLLIPQLMRYDCQTPIH